MSIEVALKEYFNRNDDNSNSNQIKEMLKKIRQSIVIKLMKSNIILNLLF